MSTLRNRRGIALLTSLAAVSSLFALIAPAHSATESRWAYVLFNAGSHNSDMSGSTDDIHRATSLRTGLEGLLYVRDGGSAYVVRDAAVLRKAKSLFDPEDALGAQQTALGVRQARLGEQQSRLGNEQTALADREANSTPAQQVALARQQEVLGQQQNELGRQQDALGRQQDALGREQDRLDRIADQDMHRLFQDALRSGLAQRVE